MLPVLHIIYWVWKQNMKHRQFSDGKMIMDCAIFYKFSSRERLGGAMDKPRCFLYFSSKYGEP